MARTTGPLMSLSASGSVAKTLTYAHWKGRPYVRQLVTPSNPRSQGQYYTRAMMAFLSRVWAQMELVQPGDQATWDTLAKQGNYSAFNAFVKTNMLRWTQGAGAITKPDASGGGTQDTFAAVTPTAGVRQISINVDVNAGANGFGYAFAVDPANSATPAATQTREIAQASVISTNTPFDVLISQLEPGTYSICLFQFTQNGVLHARSNVTQGLIVT